MVHARPACGDMVVKGAPGALRITRGDGIEYFLMLGRRHRQASAAAGKRLPPVEVQFVDNAPVGREQFLVTGELHQRVVKLQIERLVGVDILFRRGFFHALEDAA